MAILGQDVAMGGRRTWLAEKSWPHGGGQAWLLGISFASHWFSFTLFLPLLPFSPFQPLPLPFSPI